MNLVKQVLWVSLILNSLSAISQLEEKGRIIDLISDSDSVLYDNPQLSLELATEANSLAKALSNDSLIALTLNRIGSAQWSLGNELDALEKIQASLQLAEANKFESIIAKNLGNIGNIYAASGLDLDAIGYYKSELDLQKKAGNTFRLFAINNNIGKAFLDLKKTDSATKYLKEASNFLDPSFEQFYSIYFFNQAELSFNQREFEETDSLLRLTFSNSEKFNSKRGLIRANQLQAELDLVMRNYEKALSHAQMAFSLAKESKVKELIYISSKTLSRCFGALGRYKEAYEKELLHEAYLDSVRNISIVNELELLSYYQRLFQLRVLESKNSTNEELAEQRQLIIQGLVLALVIAAVLIAIIVLVVRELGARKRKLESLNSFKAKIFAIVSHDLKSPIQSVSSVIEMFNEKLITKEEIEPFLPEVKAKTSNLMNLLNNVFLWAEGQMEGEHFKSEKFSLYDVLLDLESELNERIEEKEIKLEIASAQNFHLISDSGIVRILMRNLIVNAIKFSNKNSTVEVHCVNGKSTKVVEVIDHGIGMTEEVKAKLFNGELESTIGTSGERGNGLGLALCFDFVKNLGDKMEVESTLGEGSVFRIIFKDQHA